MLPPGFLFWRILRLYAKVKQIYFSNFLGKTQRPSRGRSAGVTFWVGRKSPKTHQRRGLPPPCGIHPAVRDAPASSWFRPWSWMGHIDGLEAR